MTLPWSGQKKLLSTYRVHTLSEAGTAVGTAMGKAPSLSLGVSQLTNSEWLGKPSLSSASLLCDSAMCSVVNQVCLTTPGQDPIIYSAVGNVLVIEKSCPVDHSVDPRASGGGCGQLSLTGTVSPMSADSLQGLWLGSEHFSVLTEFDFLFFPNLIIITEEELSGLLVTLIITLHLGQ